MKFLRKDLCASAIAAAPIVAMSAAYADEIKIGFIVKTARGALVPGRMEIRR
ncbi:hypothetical protein [Pseudorhodobacter sp.]|uniref:hypothetical protein n=1 Tax=Pseudorhodobacter sp. TaxID=1934400 RepID=UPI003464A97A